jgi:hypothetical protein
MIESTRDIIRHPATVFSAAVAAAGTLFNVPFLDALLGVLWANVPTLFTASSIGAFTVAPNLGDLPAQVVEAMQVVAILLGVAYGGKLLLGVWRDAEQRLD